jgi:hypothetical protein
MTMPDTDLKPDEQTGPIARDPLHGLEVPVYLGGDTLVVEEPTGDRGDALVSSSQAPSPEPSAPEIEPTGDKAPDAEPPALTDEQQAALPVRDPETGRFLPKDGEPGAKGEETKGEETKGEDQPRIPKVRLDKEIQRRKEAEARLAEKEAAEKAAEKGAAQEYDFDAAEKQYMDFLLDGKLEEAAAKRRRPWPSRRRSTRTRRPIFARASTPWPTRWRRRSPALTRSRSSSTKQP